MDKESASKLLKLRQVEHWIEFVTPELYTNPDYYVANVGMKYYLWNGIEFEEYSVTPELEWKDLERYFNNRLLYIND